jgi:two-component system osmolarity sensor histidine kinase EnvZ
MTSLDVGMSRLRMAAGRLYGEWERFDTAVKSLLPKGLYARALLIIIAPMVILQSPSCSWSGTGTR